MILTVLPSPARRLTWSRARRAIDELKAPHRPRSAVHTIRRCVRSAPVPARRRGDSGPGVMVPATLANTWPMRSAKGRAASAAVCARRSFAAATICMALVIFCVAFTEAMRLRRSLRLGIERSYSPLRKRLGEGLDGALQLGPVVVREVARGADVLQDLRMTAAHVAEQALLE